MPFNYCARFGPRCKSRTCTRSSHSAFSAGPRSILSGKQSIGEISFTMNVVVVDFQGFKDEDNNFIIKELAFGSCNSENVIFHSRFLFKPPFDLHELPRRTQFTISGSPANSMDSSGMKEILNMKASLTYYNQKQ